MGVSLVVVSTIKFDMSDMQASPKLTYFFGAGQAEGGSELRDLVGGKGASLADMTRAQLNVPPGFTISAECCDLYYKGGKNWPTGLEEAVRTNLARLEQLAGRTFGRGNDPLLVAVRSGAAHSMPGMMDTVLNVGLNPGCVQEMAIRTGKRRGAWDAYRHFLVMFGHTVGDIDETVFTGLIADMLRETGKHAEADLDAEQMEALCRRFLDAYRVHAGRDMPTEPWEMLRAAIDAVFNSWNNDRAIAYRKHHKIDGLLGTAVNVQIMCPAEVSGVLFTANPVNPALEQIILESSYGLGEAIVLGKVTPDRFVVDKKSLAIVERTISVKAHIVVTVPSAAGGVALAGSGGDAASTTPPAARPSLTDDQVTELAKLGLRVESYFQRPSDIEWALSAGQFYLLQARAIKGLAGDAKPHAGSGDPEREKVRQEEIATLSARAEPGGTVWSRFNLSEILPEPTPMTWAIVRRFMSVRGGFGLMYKDLGFEPDPALGEEGVFDLVCGRPYYNLSREPRMQHRRLPFEHNFAALKANPAKAIYPQPTFNPSRAGWRFWLFLPLIFFRMTRSAVQLNATSKTFADKLRKEIIPAFSTAADTEAAKDLSGLSNQALLEKLDEWIRRTLNDFARDSLKPTALAAVAMNTLERGLTRPLGQERARAALGELIMGVHPDPDADLPGNVRALAEGRLDRDTFLQRFGHRGSHEMELAHPRWAEDPTAIANLCQSKSEKRGAESEQRETSEGSLSASRSPLLANWERIATETKLAPPQRALLEGELKLLHDYLALRETGKHYLMKGYALIRRILVELDRRFKLDGGIFFLTPDELPRLLAGEDLSARIAERRHRRDIVLSIEVPQVIFSDDLEAIGRSVQASAAETLQGTPLSAGVAEGEALVLLDPSGAVAPTQPYILVCPTTDPAWVPLFVNARALVMETGGVLSHGAIVAREFGLPAVAGLPDVHRRLRNGQKLRVNGGTGTVSVL